MIDQWISLLIAKRMVHVAAYSIIVFINCKLQSILKVPVTFIFPKLAIFLLSLISRAVTLNVIS